MVPVDYSASSCGPDLQLVRPVFNSSKILVLKTLVQTLPISVRACAQLETFGNMEHLLNIYTGQG